MSTPTVSIVMPVYGAEKYLKSSIECILNQTFSDFQLILIDDKSPDNCPKICDEYALKDERIKVIHLNENGGASNARNIGIDEAKGKYIIFLDSDDTFDENLLEMCVSSIKENNAQVVLYGLVEEYFDNNGNIVRTNTVTLDNKILEGEQQVRNEVIYLEKSDLYGYACNKLYDLKYLKDNGVKYPIMAFNEDIIFNIDFFMNVSKCNILSAAPYHYAKRSNASTTSRFIPTYYKDIMIKINRLYEQFEAWDMLNSVVLEEIASKYVRYVFSTLQRNCDKRSNMNFKDRKAFFDKELETDIYKKLREYMAGGGLSGIMAKFFKSKNRFMCLTIAKIIYMVKTYFPKIFEKIN